MTKDELANLNKSGLTKHSTFNNNVFMFLACFEEHLEHARVYSGVVDLSEGATDNKKLSVAEQEHLLEVCDRFLEAFQGYLLSGACSTKPVDTDIIKLKFKGVKNGEVCEKLGLKSSTLRVRCSRLTKRVYRKVFASENITEAIAKCVDLDAIEKAYRRICKEDYTFLVKDIFPYEYSNKVDQVIASGVGYRNSLKTTETEYLKALRFYFLYSKDVFNCYLKAIDPRMLALAKKQLEAKEVSDLAMKYKQALDHSAEFILNNEKDFINALIDGELDEETERQEILKTAFVEPVIEEDEIVEPVQIYSGVAFNLLISKELSDEFVKAIKKYETYERKCLDGGTVDKYYERANSDTRKEAKLFFESLTTKNSKSIEEILRQAKQLNPYDFVYLLKNDYKIGD